MCFCVLFDLQGAATPTRPAWTGLVDIDDLMVRTYDVLRKLNLGEWNGNIANVDQMCFCVLFDLQGAATPTRPAWTGLVDTDDLLVRTCDVLRKFKLGGVE
jgi:hypothetical protein